MFQIFYQVYFFRFSGKKRGKFHLMFSLICLMHIKSRSVGNVLQACFYMEVSPSVLWSLNLNLVQGNCLKWYHREVFPSFHMENQDFKGFSNSWTVFVLLFIKPSILKGHGYDIISWCRSQTKREVKAKSWFWISVFCSTKNCYVLDDAIFNYSNVVWETANLYFLYYWVPSSTIPMLCFDELF